METVFFARIDPGFNFGNILPYRGADVARFGKEILGEFRDVAAGDPECVMHHQDLPVGDVARADADTLLELTDASQRAVILMAAWLGQARLIDNQIVTLGQ